MSSLCGKRNILLLIILVISGELCWHVIQLPLPELDWMHGSAPCHVNTSIPSKQKNHSPLPPPPLSGSWKMLLLLLKRFQIRSKPKLAPRAAWQISVQVVGRSFRRCYESEPSIKLMSLKEFERLHLFLGHWFALCFCKGLQQELSRGNTESDGTASYDKSAQQTLFFKVIDVMIILKVR